MFIVDGLQCGIYDRQELEFLVKSDVRCITITAAFWEDALETMDNIVKWHELELEHPDLIKVVRSYADIENVRNAGDRVAVIIGTQNSTPLNDRLGFVELFRDMGLLVMQLTYNQQNAIATGCYEPVDSGLTEFGKEVVAEMNRVGMLVDLSHVADKSTRDAIDASSRPVAINHANPMRFFEHPRNKSDETLRALASNGGVIGLTPYSNIAGEWATTEEKFCRMLVETAEAFGIEHVGLGTDLHPGIGAENLTWMRRGRWSRKDRKGAALYPVPPEYVTAADQLAPIAEYLRSHGLLSETEIDAVMTDNWLRVYAKAFDRQD